MESFSGSQALSEYLTTKKKPTFKQFVTLNYENLAKWSIDIASNKPESLRGVWLERYRKVLKHVKPKYAKPKNSKYNAILWSDIMSRVHELRRKRGDCMNEGLLLLNANLRQGSSINSVLDDSGEEETDSESEETDCKEIDDNEETAGGDTDSDQNLQEQVFENNSALAKIAMKKLSGKFRSNDKEILSSLVEKGEDMLSRLNNHIIKLLGQEHLTEVESEMMKLFLSSAVNLLDDTMVALTSEVLSPGQLIYLAGEKHSWLGMDLPTAFELDGVIDDNDESMDDLLYAIQSKKAEMTKKKERGSDLYHILFALDIIVENMDTKLREDASETTCYRRFSILLDFVFKGLAIELKDGELVCEATQMAMEQNTYDEQNSFGRKIDVLINVQGTNIALNSNEWKSNKTAALKMKQQSKNIRSNCSILNMLHVITQGSITSVMAMDVVGTVGYLYLLELKRNVYVATLVNTVFIPSAIEELESFKDTLNTLFIWRNFMRSQIKTIRKCLLKKKLASSATNLYQLKEEEIGTALPRTFFSPKSNRVAKRVFADIDTE